MAALLRGVARSFALVAAARSGALEFSTRGAGAGVTGRTRTVMASLPGFCGTGFSRPVLSLTPASAHQLSSSSSFLAYQRLSMRPQVKAIGNGSKQINAFQLKSQEGQAISVRDFEDAAPSTQPRESWAPSRIPDDRSSYSGNGMGRSYNSRPKSMSVGNIAPRTRFVKTTPSNDVFQDSQAFRRNPSPFRQKEYSSSAVLEGFDDNEGEMDVETYKRTHDISTSGSEVPDPYMTFGSTGFPPTLMRELESAGFSSPSAIQAMTWPIAGAGRDVVAIAKTGSGKTLGYLVPAFLRLEKERSGYRRDPTVLVLAPTRELANQIRDEAWKFGRSSRVAVTCVCGGTPKGPQLRDIDRGVDVIVATPGRLNDLLEMRAVNLQKVTYLVLDEADRMLDMGFEPQIRAIVDQMSPKRQTLMYTATWPHEVRRIARDLMTNPVQVNIGNSDVLSANKNITQIVEVVSRFEKDKRLDEILANVEEGSKVLIFCTTKRMCDDLAMNMRNKYGALAIHGDKSQRERDYVMQQFKRGRTPVLVATDVAARGLDIKDIKMVLNYDFPTCVEDYVHRIGRTGRAGATGIAHTFFGYEDAKHAGDLIKVLESTGQQVLPDLRQMGGRNGNSRGGNSRYGGRGGGGGFRSQPSYYTGKSDAFGSGSRYGQSDRMGGDRYGGYGGDRFGSDNKFGGDRFGGDNRFGGDRFGGDKKFGGDRFGGESKFGSDRFSGSNSFGGDNRFGSDRFGSESKFGTDRFGSDGKFESDRFGSDRVGVDKFGSGRFGGVKTSSDITGSNVGGGDAVGDDSTSSKPKTLLDFDFSSEKYTKKPPRPMRAGRRFNQTPMQSTTTLPSFDSYATTNDKSMLTPNYGELKMNPDGTMSLW